MRDTLDSRLFDQAYAVLDGATAPPGPWAFTQVYVRPARGGPNMVYRARHETTGQLVAVKANSRPNINRQQFNALKRLSGVMPDAVRPLGLAPDARFFVMEWHDAPLLLERMPTAQRLEGIARAGQWLRRLHARTARAAAGRDGFLEDRPLLPPDTCPGEDDVRARLEARYAALPRTTGRIAMLHTDYQLHNLFDMGGRLVAFDRAMNRVGLVHFDVARFLVGAALYRALAAAEGAPWPDDADLDRQVFFGAYGALADDDLPLYDFIEDLLVARLWRFFTLRPDNPRNAVRAPCLDEMMRQRGLRDPVTGVRPLRLVRGRFGWPGRLAGAATRPQPLALKEVRHLRLLARGR